MDYLSLKELVQPAGFGFLETPYPPKFVTDLTRWPALLKAFNLVRTHVGSPLRVLPGGGYRSTEYNKALYAARNEPATNSQHSQGRAVDIKTAKMSAEDLHALILTLYESGDLEIGGLGIYDTFVHFDVRIQDPKHPHLARWDQRTKHSKNS